MKNQQYLLIKDEKTKEIVYMDYDKLSGFQVNPANQSNYDGITINKMIIIKPSFIEKVLKRKIKRKLENYLKLVISILDDEDSSNDNTDLRYALNDLNRYKSIIKNKYQQYLDEKYIELLLKKVALIEKEIKNKMIYYKEPKVQEEDYLRKR